MKEVLEIARTRVGELMRERGAGEGLSESEFAEICERVALGAVVFHDLHSDPGRDVEFDLEKVVDFEGETGPYLQYAHTRCLSIQRKAEAAGLRATADVATLTKELIHPAEVALIRGFGRFPANARTLPGTTQAECPHPLPDGRGEGLWTFLSRVSGRWRRSGRIERTPRTRGFDAKGVVRGDSGLLGIPLPERM